MDHFENLEFDLGKVTLQWLSSLFAFNTNQELCLKIWDIFWLKGIKFVFKMSLAILYLLAPKLMLIDKRQRLYETIQQFQVLLPDPLVIFQVADMPKFKVTSTDIKEQRIIMRAKLIKQLEYHRKVPSKKKLDLEGLLEQLPLFRGLQL